MTAGATLYAIAPDGVRLVVDSVGQGTPLLFIHEFAGDSESWEPQISRFCGRYRCLAYNARGYPPSDVPADPAAYSQDAAVVDALAVLDAAGVEAAHLVGLSMGGYCALYMALSHPERCLSITVAGAGYGAHPAEREAFRRETELAAQAFERDLPSAAARYAVGPSRVRYQLKDPHGWARFADRLAQHDPHGMASTLRGVLGARPSLFDLGDRLERISTPTLILVGDEDEGCLEAALFLKRRIRPSGLAIFPNASHTLNLEEPALFDAHLDEFLNRVQLGHWETRPASAGGGLVGMVTGVDEAARLGR